MTETQTIEPRELAEGESLQLALPRYVRQVSRGRASKVHLREITGIKDGLLRIPWLALCEFAPSLGWREPRSYQTDLTADLVCPKCWERKHVAPQDRIAVDREYAHLWKGLLTVPER